MFEFSEEIYKQFLNRARKDLVPVGSIMCFPYQKYPSGYLPCDGREVLINQYPDLYHLIGNSFGTPEEKNCFRLPDLQGQFIRGWDNDGDIDPERDFASHQSFAIQGHGHKTKAINTSSNGSHVHRVYYKEYKVGSNTWTDNDKTVYEVAGNDYDKKLGCDKGTETNGSHQHEIPSLKAAEIINTNYNEVTVATETRPTNIALLYCIKAL